MAAMSPELPTPAPSPQGERMPSGAVEWIAHIRERDMPAFAATVAAVRDVTGDERASASRLARVILQDAALTTRVLKLANSAFHNPTRQGISTISRAIVVLGFDLVADIALGVALVDAMLSGGVRGRVVQEMARSFHAAVQARALAQLRRDPRAEEIFIATLLARVGEMAFWCFGGTAAERLDGLLSQPSGCSAEAVQVTELGFRLHQLSVGLAREWRLGALLSGVLEGRGRPGPAEQAVQLGHKLALAAEQGWTGPEMAAMLAEIGEFAGVAPEALLPQLAREAEQAARIVTVYGAPEAARQIPLLAPVATEEAPAPAATGPDPLLQLSILRELSVLISAGGRLNETLQLALEGMLRGIGLGRVLFALVTPNRQQVVGKSGLGLGAEALAGHFVVSLGGAPEDLFNALLAQPRPLLLDGEGAPAGLRLQRLHAIAGAVPACLAPILAQGRMVGLFYADRGASRAAIAQADFEAFCHFAQQVSFAFSAASSRRA
jgi:HD-like signal output (HDOD) protein